MLVQWWEKREGREERRIISPLTDWQERLWASEYPNIFDGSLFPFLFSVFVYSICGKKRGNFDWNIFFGGRGEIASQRNTRFLCPRLSLKRGGCIKRRGRYSSRFLHELQPADVSCLTSIAQISSFKKRKVWNFRWLKEQRYFSPKKSLFCLQKFAISGKGGEEEAQNGSDLWEFAVGVKTRELGGKGGKGRKAQWKEGKKSAGKKKGSLCQLQLRGREGISLLFPNFPVW